LRAAALVVGYDHGRVVTAVEVGDGFVSGTAALVFSL
jgi:hypothetical protein